MIPTGLELGEQGDRDRVEADGRPERGRQLRVTPSTSRRRPTRRARPRGHRQMMIRAGVHAGVAGRIRVGADGPDLEPEGRPNRTHQTTTTATKARTIPRWPVPTDEDRQRGIGRCSRSAGTRAGLKVVLASRFSDQRTRCN